MHVKRSMLLVILALLSVLVVAEAADKTLALRHH